MKRKSVAKRLIKLGFYGKIFKNFSNIKFHENPSSGSRVVPNVRKEGQIDTMKLVVAFRNFANAPKNFVISTQ